MEIIVDIKPKIYIYNLPYDMSNLIMSYVGIWSYISENVNLSQEQIKKYQAFIDWKMYSIGINDLNYSIVKHYYKKLYWDEILNKWTLINKIQSPNNLHIPLEYVNFINIAKNQVFNNEKCINIILNNKSYFYSIHFIDCFTSYLDWEWIIINIKLSPNALYKYFHFIKKIEEKKLYKHQNITDMNLLIKIQDYINWDLFSFYQDLTLHHYLKFYRKLCWDSIFKAKTLSHHILNRLPMCVIYNNLHIITTTQSLDEEFITNNVKILDAEKICNNKKIDKQIRQRIYKNYQSNKYILLLNNNTYTEFLSNL